MPDVSTSFRPALRKPIGTAGHLRAALLELAGGLGDITRLSERAWASITFEGARFTVELAFTGEEAVSAGELFIATLPDHEFAIPGQLVADATVTAVDHALAPCAHLAVTCELLLLKDC